MANIKTHLNNIKSALYGKDVRGSIHDGIDAINKEVEGTTKRQVDLENIFDQLVINAGNSNAEIVDARVKSDGTSYSKLGDRLNEVDSQLAHIKTNHIKTNQINVKEFGAKGDGVTDDSEAIQRAILSLAKDGGELIFPQGVYIHGDGITTGYDYTPYTTATIDGKIKKRPDKANGATPGVGRDISFCFNGFKNLTIRGEGATILSHELNGEVKNNRIFYFEDCENIKIENIKIDGNIQERNFEYTDYDPGGYFSKRHNLEFNNCENVVINNIVSNGSAMDGLILVFCKNVKVYNSLFLYNYRQGITINAGCENVTIRDCNLSYTGVISGTQPMSGIDLESDGSMGYINNTVIDNCIFKENVGNSILIMNQVKNTKILNSLFERNVFLGGAHPEKNYNTFIYNCDFINDAIKIEQTNLTIDSCRFYYDKDLKSKGLYNYIDSTIPADSTISEIKNPTSFKFTNNTIQCNHDGLENGHSLFKNMGMVSLKGDMGVIENNIFRNITSTSIHGFTFDFSTLYLINNNFYLDDDYTGLVSTYTTGAINYTNAIISGNIRNGYVSSTWNVKKVNTIDI